MSNFLKERAIYQNCKTERMEVVEPTTDEKQRQQTLRECVTSSLEEYFEKVGYENISNLYDLVLTEVEAPLLQTVMQHTRSNQSKASAMLGLNRGTLRTKLKKYGMLN
jgi:Fis family transcriptional regulator